jgi:hypothetical protein
MLNRASQVVMMIVNSMAATTTEIRIVIEKDMIDITIIQLEEVKVGHLHLLPIIVNKVVVQCTMELKDQDLVQKEKVIITVHQEEGEEEEVE